MDVGCSGRKCQHHLRGTIQHGVNAGKGPLDVRVAGGHKSMDPKPSIHPYRPPSKRKPDRTWPPRAVNQPARKAATVGRRRISASRCQPATPQGRERDDARGQLGEYFVAREMRDAMREDPSSGSFREGAQFCCRFHGKQRRNRFLVAPACMQKGSAGRRAAPPAPPVGRRPV